MNKLYVIFLMGVIQIFAINANAALVTCSAAQGETVYGDSSNNQVLLVETLKGHCDVKRINVASDRGWETENLEFEIKGLGLGLQVSGEIFTLICPNALAKNLTKNPFFGMKASAAALLGADIGVFSNKRGGICFLTGIKVGIGAGISAAKLQFN